MKKLICLSSLLFSASMLFTGCSNEIPAMSQGEQEAVVEYAANIVLKYDKRQAARLKEVEEVELSGLQEDAPPDAAATPEASTMEPDPEVEIVDPFGESQDSGPSELPLEDFLQVENVTFTYGGYEIADSYPEAGEGVYFTMNATPGISLLVMKFTAQNTGTETEEVDLLSLGARYKVTVNGETKMRCPPCCSMTLPLIREPWRRERAQSWWWLRKYRENRHLPWIRFPLLPKMQTQHLQFQ